MFYIDFRKYQLDMLEVFEQKRRTGKRKYHFVAPPGSGKTLIGLEIMDRLGQPSAVFSPTVAIQSQWVTVCRELSNGVTASTDPYSTAYLLSLTYQVVSTKQRQSDSPHQNARRILELLKGRKTIIFDECHHLTDYWAKVLQDLDREGVSIIGLTATPPFDHEKGEQDTYLRLLGEVDYEILLPPVIKDGYLAAFQDLVFVVEPQDHELEMIGARCSSYRMVMDELFNTTNFLSLQHWVSNRLENYLDRDGRIVAIDELQQNNGDFVAAAVRVLRRQHAEVPLSVVQTPEMTEEPNFSDMLLVLQDYLNNYLLTIPEAMPAVARLQQALREIGFSIGPESIKSLPKGIKSLLVQSRAKILALQPIIQQEMMAMGEDFCCLILTDSERHSTDTGISAFEIMRYLTSNPETDGCDPIMVTGKTVLVDDDLVSEFMVCAEAFIERQGQTLVLESRLVEGFHEISCSSPTWNTRLYVSLITWLLERGVTKCLVSTTSMLGEGWNAVRLNTLIDLSTGASHALVNQIRGRTIRLDENRPFKTANNWDIVTVFADPEQGSYDLDRLHTKYSRFFGLGLDGTIEKGIGHAHSVLADRSAERIHQTRAVINAEMIQRAGDRMAVYQKWGIQQKYANQIIQCMELEQIDRTAGKWNAIMQAELDSVIWRIKRTRQGVLGLLLGLGSFLPSMVGMPQIGAPSAALVLIVGFQLWQKLRHLRRPHSFQHLRWVGLIKWILGRRQSRPDRQLWGFCWVILEAIRKCGLAEHQVYLRDVVISKVQDGRRHLFVPHQEVSAFLNQALLEILGPAGQTKYLVHFRMNNGSDVPVIAGLFREKRRALTERLYSEECIIAVPSIFCRKKADAETFLSLWKNRFGAQARLAGIRSEEGRRWLTLFRNEHPFPLKLHNKELWI